MKIARLAGRDASARLAACLAELDPSQPEDYRQLAALLAGEWQKTSPRVIGLAGGQGAGKSTLGRLIQEAAEFYGLRACVLSLDDFYLPKDLRQSLAASVHPLLETRGPPGTHDMVQCRTAIDALSQNVEVALPIFDKGADDRDGWRHVCGPFDLIVLEGWCVGAVPESGASLRDPINALESLEDSDGVWRRYVNSQLQGPYSEVWSQLDSLMYLRVPDLAAVRRWRLLQEDQRPVEQRMDSSAIDRFVQHYERITRSMWQTIPSRADFVIELAEDHSIRAIQSR